VSTARLGREPLRRTAPRSPVAPENATGNWVKVGRPAPARAHRIDTGGATRPFAQLGLSAHVEVDTLAQQRALPTRLRRRCGCNALTAERPMEKNHPAHKVPLMRSPPARNADGGGDTSAQRFRLPHMRDVSAGVDEITWVITFLPGAPTRSSCDHGLIANYYGRKRSTFGA